MKILLIGTFDTKYNELIYFKDKLSLKAEVITFDIGVFPIDFQSDYSYKDFVVNTNYKDVDFTKLPKSETMKVYSELINNFSESLYEKEKFDGVISIGGGCGTSLASIIYKKIPFGIPKVIISSILSGVRGYDFYGHSDICFFPSILDISGMCEENYSTSNGDLSSKKIRIGITMFGVTQECVDKVKSKLQLNENIEVFVFHATGTGGDTLEYMAKIGFIDYIIDLTTTEFADLLYGGILPATPDRLTANVPRIVSFGAIDMINFGRKETVPQSFDNSIKYEFNLNTTLIRTNKAQNNELGSFIGKKVKNIAEKNNIRVIIPLNGFSKLDKKGSYFYNENFDSELINSFKQQIPDSMTYEVNGHINDDIFADKIVDVFYTDLLERNNKIGENNE